MQPWQVPIRPELVRLSVQCGCWLVALAWLVRVMAAHFGLPRVPNLLRAEHDVSPVGEPSVTVIVPARNEAKDVCGCLESLLAQDYPALQVLAVDDRSTDETGALMHALAAANPGRMQAISIEALPPGWLGKSHAMSVAAGQVESEFLLFTDADIFFERTAIRRALASAVATGADHMVLLPSTIIKRWDEAALLAFFQIFGLWAARPWKVADPGARDAIGVGAFNLIRRSAYERIGGFAAFPMEIVEDLGLARRVKQAGLAQRVASGVGLVRVHWASGVRGLINVMTKNIFSVFNFHPSLLLLSCCWLTAFAIAPFFAIFVPWLTVPALVAVGAIAYAYVLMGRLSGLSAWNALLAPFAAGAFVYAVLRSMTITLRQGGVIWRGTFYSLAELRRNTVPLFPRRASKETS